MTVSRVLRGASAAPATRKLVETTATRLGYRAHPLVNAFMTEMRRRGARRRVTANIAWLCGQRSLQEWKTDSIWAGYLRGAQEAATVLGYALTAIEDKREAITGPRLTAILRARGVRGIILPPLVDQFDPPIDHTQFSFVRIGGKWAGVAWHKVMPDYAINQHIIWRQLRMRGIKRIGLFVTHEHLVESQGNTLSGFLFNQQLMPENQRITPCIAGAPSEMPALFHRWRSRQRPEVIITDCAVASEWLASAPASQPPSHLVHVSLSPVTRKWAGIDLRPETQGRCAIEMLNGLILRNETGPPVSQQKVLLAGLWCDGSTLPPINPKASARPVDPDFLRPTWYDQWSSIPTVAPTKSKSKSGR
jgi:LacI family transcriptional regulator